jgi:hypothetical protein
MTKTLTSKIIIDRMHLLLMYENAYYKPVRECTIFGRVSDFAILWLKKISSILAELSLRKRYYTRT